MTVRILLPDDALAFQALRLRGLADEPTAFASSVEEERDLPLAEVARRLTPADEGVVLGSFDSTGRLCGVLGLRRERMRKLAHKAHLWGMYVLPPARRDGHGQRLLQQALAHAWHTMGVRQVNLGVHAHNEPALRLYRRLGFEVYGTEIGALMVGQVLQDEHHMVCRAVSPARGAPGATAT